MLKQDWRALGLFSRLLHLHFPLETNRAALAKAGTNAAQRPLGMEPALVLELAPLVAMQGPAPGGV
jgi:hypothetical protein